MYVEYEVKQKEGFQQRRLDFPFLFRDPIGRDCEQTGGEVSYGERNSAIKEGLVHVYKRRKIYKGI